MEGCLRRKSGVASYVGFESGRGILEASRLVVCMHEGGASLRNIRFEPISWLLLLLLLLLL